MQNLVKIQENLKNVPLQAVMAYVEGRNPMVPPYLALTELNRRKQIQESQQSQQQPQGTVKDQIQQQTGLMALQAARQQAAQQNMQQGAAAMPQPQALPVQGAPVQGNPAPVVQAAEGGLMRMPMRSDMFKEDSYAGGGIVAFKRGGRSEEDEEDYEIDPTTGERYKSVNPLGFLNIGKTLRGGKTIEEYYNEKPTTTAAAPVAPTAAAPAAAPVAPPANPNLRPPQPGGVASLGGGYGPLMSMKPRSTSLEDIYKEQQAADRLAGVASPDQRYAKSDEMIAKLREQMTGQRSAGAMADLAQSMGEGAAAGPYWWQSAAGYGSSAGKAIKSRQELYNKQDEAFATLERTKEKEEDAIRRGNSNEIQKAKDAREKAEFDLNKTKAEVQYRQESVENKGDVAQERLDLEKEKALMKAPDYQSLVMKQTSLENKLRKDPNDQKAKQELDRVREEIAKKRAEAGIASRSGGAAPAPAKKYEGFSGTRVN